MEWETFLVKYESGNNSLFYKLALSAAVTFAVFVILLFTVYFVSYTQVIA